MTQENKSLGKSVLWSAFDKFGGVFIAFLLNLILARFFLTPRDFGLIGMINIFISLANTTVIGGFGQAVIQTKNLTQEDINTTFTFNFSVSILLYVILFYSAPWIATFYNTPILKDLVRVLSFILIINSFFIIQNSLLIRNMQFRKLSIINNVSLILSSSLAVICACKGLGVWSLIINTLLASFFQTIILWSITKVKVRIGFNREAFKKLFSFGGFMYISTLIEVFYSNALYLILGKGFSPQLLGYYTQAEKLQSVPVTTVGTVVNQVAFPFFSKLQETKDEVAKAFKTVLSYLSFFSASMMTCLFTIASPLILFLFTEKWADSIPILRILSISGIFLPLNTASTTVIKSLGKGKLFFNLQLWKRIGGLITLIILSLFGFKTLLYGVCSINIIFYLINIFFVKKVLEIKYLELIKIPLNYILKLSVISGITTIIQKQIDMPDITSLITSTCILGTLFIILMELTKDKQYISLKNKFIHKDVPNRQN